MNSVIPHNHQFAREQCIKAAWEPIDQPTNWPKIIAEAGELNAEAIKAELLAGSPYELNPLNKLRVWRLQTKYRIALRHQRNLPQEDQYRCASCGKNPRDPVVLECLPCAEQTFLAPRPSDVSSSYGFHPAFDTDSKTWGIAYLTHENYRNHSAAIVVAGYATALDARIAAYAHDRFVELYNSVVPAGLAVDESETFKTGEFFKLNLPTTPDVWRTFVNKGLAGVKTEDAEPYDYDINQAAQAFFREKH